MKNIYTKLLIIFTLMFGMKNTTSAQYWTTGDAINDTIKYLTLVAWQFDTTFDNTCYEMGLPDHHFLFQPCPDPGIDYGYVVEEITNTGDTIEITPSGLISLGDTVWCLNTNVDRQIYFNTMGGHVKLRFFAIGEATTADVEVPCQPADDIWFSNLLLCNEFVWIANPCVIAPNPLGIEDLFSVDADLSYPNRMNSYQLTVESNERVSRILVFDIQGRKSAESVDNTVDFSNLNDGVYLITVIFDSGKALKEKIVINK